MSAAGFLTRLRRAATRLILLLGVPGIAIAIGVYVYATGGRFIETENAYVKANIIAISAQVAGRVVEVGVRDHQQVQQGDLLFRLDPRRYAAEVAATDAALLEVRSEIETLRADYQEIAIREREARERERYLERQLSRQQRLNDRKLGSAEDQDEAAHELDMARFTTRAIGQQKQRVLTRLGGKLDLPVEAHPRYRAAEAARNSARIALADTVVRAPVAGVVSNVTLQPGEFADEGDALFSLIETGPIWIEANLKETQLTHVREGQLATVVADVDTDRTWEGLVQAIAPATGAQFALLPPQNASGNWVKVVQRITVKLELVDPQASAELRAGMTVTARIDTEHRRDLRKTLQRVAQSWGLPVSSSLASDKP